MSKYQSGKLDSQYDYDHNNHYALSKPDEKAGNDIVQCKVHLRRSEHTSGGGRAGLAIQIKYEAEVFDYKGKSKGKGSATGPSKDKPLIVKGLDPDVKIWHGDSSITLGDKPNYQADNVHWTNDKEGYGGAYCAVGNVDGTHGTRDEDCYFPCWIS